MAIGITIQVVNAAPAGSAAQKLLLFATIGTGGTMTPDTLEWVQSEAQLRGLLGASQGAEAAAAAYFRDATFRNQTTGAELWVFGVDGSAFTVNTYTLTWTGTTLEAGTRVLRIGGFTVSIPLAKGDDPTAQALAANIAVNAANIPYTSSVLAGVQTITSAHVGVTSNQVTMTMDLFAQELGVDGSTVVILNNAVATGEPATLSVGQIDTLRTQTGTVYWVTNYQQSGWRTALNAEAQVHWDTRNNYAQILQAVTTDTPADFVTFMGGVSPTNLARITTMALGNAPDYELTTGIRTVSGILQARRSLGKDNPGLVGFVIPGLRPPQWALSDQDLFNIELVGGNAIQDLGSGNTATVPVLVGGRVKNDLNQPDLSEWTVKAILARRWFSEQLAISFQPELGDGLVSDDIAVSESETNLAQFRTLTELMLKRAITEAYVRGSPDDVADQIISITETQQVNITNGVDVVLATTFVKPLTTVKGTVNAS